MDASYPVVLTHGSSWISDVLTYT